MESALQEVAESARVLHRVVAQVGEVVEACQRAVEAARTGEESSRAFARARTLARCIDVTGLRRTFPSALTRLVRAVERASTGEAATDRRASGGYHPVDLNALMEHAVARTRKQGGHLVDLVVDLDPELPPLPGVPEHLQQAFTELLAQVAGARGGGVGKGSVARGLIAVQTRSVGVWAEIRICDTSGGLPEAGHLALIEAVIGDEHGGTVSLESIPGEGTTFVIRLPLSAGAGGCRAGHPPVRGE